MNAEQKPTLFIVIAALTLASGIANLFWGFVASAAALGTILGVVCIPITVLPTILGVFEIIYAAKLLSAQPQLQPRPAQPSRLIAAFQISTFIYGNIFSAVVGILNLIFFNDQTVKEYFAKINGVQIITPAPVPTPMPEPEPIVEPILPEPVEDPAKPKRVRKMAGK